MTDTPRRTGLFRGVDRAALVAALVRRLRVAGLDVGPTAANRLALGLQACPPTDVTTLYWVCRTTLVGDRDDIARFDQVFEAVFGGIGLPVAPGERDIGRAAVRTEGSVTRRSTPTDGLVALSGRVASHQPEVVDDAPDADDASDDRPVPELLPADLEALVDRPFDTLDRDQLDRIGRWLTDAAAAMPRRRTRRPVRAATGSIDLRRSLARARSTGEVMTLARVRPATEPRPLVVVADVSGSMESFARIHLHLIRALALRPDGGGFEAFTFALDLHRVTNALARRDAAEVIDRLSDEVADRFAGTRIATNLGRLVTSPRWSHTVRGATVVIASDGWDTDRPELLARRMERLSRMADRVVWINPRAGDPSFRPEVAGMAAALPFVDELCSGHSLRALRSVIDAIAAP